MRPLDDDQRKAVEDYLPLAEKIAMLNVRRRRGISRWKDASPDMVQAFTDAAIDGLVEAVCKHREGIKLATLIWNYANFRIATVAKDFVMGRDRMRTVPIDDCISRLHEGERSWRASEHDLAELERLVAGLPGRYRQYVTMTMRGMRQVDIAAELGVCQSCVSQGVRKSMKMLRSECAAMTMGE